MQHEVAPHPPKSPPTLEAGKGGLRGGGDFSPTEEGGNPDLDDWLDRQKMSTTRGGGFIAHRIIGAERMPCILVEGPDCACYGRGIWALESW